MVPIVVSQIVCQVHRPERALGDSPIHPAGAVFTRHAKHGAYGEICAGKPGDVEIDVAKSLATRTGDEYRISRPGNAKDKYRSKDLKTRTANMVFSCLPPPSSFVYPTLSAFPARQHCKIAELSNY